MVLPLLVQEDVEALENRVLASGVAGRARGRADLGEPNGYDGIDQRAFHPLIRVRIGGHRYPGWIHIPGQAARNQVTEIASYRQPA